MSRRHSITRGSTARVRSSSFAWSIDAANAEAATGRRMTAIVARSAAFTLMPSFMRFGSVCACRSGYATGLPNRCNAGPKLAAATDMHLVDTTLFYSPTSGGVKRYLTAKHAWLQANTSWKHSILVPGEVEHLD